MHASLTFFSEEFGSDFLPNEKNLFKNRTVQRTEDSLHVIARTTLRVFNMIKNKKQ